MATRIRWRGFWGTSPLESLHAEQETDSFRLCLAPILRLRLFIVGDQDHDRIRY